MHPVYHFQTVKHIVHGPNSLDQLPDKLALLDRPVRRIAFITQPFIEASGIAARVVTALASKDIETLIVRDVQPEPTI
jgi:alcohol dehydrogenase class IV